MNNNGYIESPSEYVENLPDVDMENVDWEVKGIDALFLVLEDIPIIGIVFYPLELIVDLIRFIFKRKH